MSQDLVSPELARPGRARRPTPFSWTRHRLLVALALACALPAPASLAEERPRPAAPGPEATASEAEPSATGPVIYIDASATMARSPGNSFVIGRRGFFSITGSSSKSLSIDAPLTIDITDDLSLYAGFDFASSKTASTPWSQLALGSFTTGFDYTFLDQAGFLPELSVSGSVSRPVRIPAGSALTTTWSGGIDADFSFDEAGHRGLIAGLALTYVTVNFGLGQLQPLYGGYVGAYHQWESGWKLTGKAGYASFGGGSLGTVIRATPARQVFAVVEFEKYDAADNKMFGVGLAGALSRSTTGKTSTSIQLVLSVPLYLTRKH
ncbi:hypothetical protein J2Y55_003116 [Bosea sp. BE125]|uniref:hypothetical protein n=1 Tax=Bosea sp. BE125 TaxID=2817909 RepID=UPI00285F1287|nr:hypothetical protein [Bosea sp. BE125]MDR6872100.1 hypothetical protein [Bosea sp. BE125]